MHDRFHQPYRIKFCDKVITANHFLTPYYIYEPENLAFLVTLYMTYFDDKTN